MTVHIEVRHRRTGSPSWPGVEAVRHRGEDRPWWPGVEQGGR
jgi:hypothetical protein